MSAIGPIRDAPKPKDQPSADPASPSREAAESFGRLVGGKKKSGGDQAAGKDGDAPDGNGQASKGPQKDNKGAGGLSDLFGQARRALAGIAPDPANMPAPANGLFPFPPPSGPFPGGGGDGVGQAVATATAASDALTQSRCGELVERILVSQPTADGAQEVRLRLDQRWLPDTEVRLLRTESGLSVEFASDDVGAQRFLLPNLSALRDRLAERLDGAVTVRMSESGADTDTGDGRSRNRRNLFEEMGDE